MNANFVSSFVHLDMNDDGVEDDIQCLNLQDNTKLPMFLENLGKGDIGL